MHFTGDVSLGTILTIATLLGIALRVGYRLGNFETTLTQHQTSLTSHETKLTSYEAQILGFVGQLQRLVGRVENDTERRRTPRR